MVQQMMDKTEPDSSTDHKEFSVKKAALRDVQNQTSSHSFITRSPVSNKKSTGKTMDAHTFKVSGTKRPSPEQSPNSNAAANAQQLVYVRRKSETEMNHQQLLSHFSDKDSKVPRFSAFAPIGKPKRVHWEERYRQLQVLLKKQDETDHQDYIQMLRSISFVELSRHAIELEKRSIQLSFEEAKEIQRVAYLNVLGRNLRPTFSVQQQLLPPRK